MFKRRIFYTCAVFVLAGWASCEAIAGTTVVIQPVSATGTNTIIGTDIFLPSGPQRVGFEFRVAGWGPRELKTAQAGVDASRFDNGSAALSPASISCPSNNSAGNSFCAQTLGAGSRCNLGCPSGGTVGCHCEWGFQSTIRADYVAFGFGNFSASDMTATSGFRCGMTINDTSNIPDPGVSLYLGTFHLDVPAGAAGVYDIRINEVETLLRSGEPPPEDHISIELYAGARIIIGVPVAPGSRYVTYHPGSAETQTAVRVTLRSIYHPGPPVAPGEDRDFSALEGFVRWAGPPNTFPDSAPGSTLRAAKLQCTPFFADWGSLGTVQLYGDAIIPSSVYHVVQVPISCQNDPDDPSCFGPVQIIHTGQWGDAAAPFARSDQAAQPDLADVTAIVDGFRGVLGAASKTLTQLRGVAALPSTQVNFIDVQLAIDAFEGKPFPYPVPAACP